MSPRRQIPEPALSVTQMTLWKPLGNRERAKEKSIRVSREIMGRWRDRGAGGSIIVWKELENAWGMDRRMRG